MMNLKENKVSNLFDEVEKETKSNITKNTKKLEEEIKELEDHSIYKINKELEGKGYRYNSLSEVVEKFSVISRRLPYSVLRTSSHDNGRSEKPDVLSVALTTGIDSYSSLLLFSTVTFAYSLSEL